MRDHSYADRGEVILNHQWEAANSKDWSQHKSAMILGKLHALTDSPETCSYGDDSPNPNHSDWPCDTVDVHETQGLADHSERLDKTPSAKYSDHNGKDQFGRSSLLYGWRAINTLW